MARIARERPTAAADDGFFRGEDDAQVWLIRNLSDNVLVIPHGDVTAERDGVKDLVIGVHETRPIPMPERWQSSPNLRRARELGLVEIYRGPLRDAYVPQLPKELAEPLGSLREIEKARQLVLHPNWEQQLRIINVRVGGNNSVGPTQMAAREWMTQRLLPKLRAALWFETEGYRFNRPERVEALRQRIAQLENQVFDGAA